ncbi:prolactin-inducible protein homolog [Peromyscus californicus insignis]|uniref:prolactin-inducible protein homolog n=1 Tax=Peromyscus californicus insignis TaxID=564181 RepID=UPI0022A71AA1|nr:prolactin-inducible protein homolog [Peromyscus californicus insignis]
MLSLQVLHQPGAVIHLLVMCLILETAYGQDNRNNLFSVNMEMSPMENADEFIVEITITNNVDKCMAVKVSTEDNPNIEYLSAHAAYTACICTTNNFFWNIQVSGNAVLQGKAEVVPATGICPEGEKIYPVTTYMRTTSREISVTP